MASPRSFAPLVSQHAAAMRRTAAALVGWADAEDVAQEAVLQAWQAWESLRDEEAVRGRLLRITVNVGLQWRRGSFGRQRTNSEPLTDERVEELATLETNPGTRDHTGSMDLRSAIKALGQDQRLAVEYPYIIPSTAGDGTARWIGAEVTGANVVTTKRADFSLTCIRQITVASGEATPAAWTGTCTPDQIFDFAFAVNVTHCPVASATWTATMSPEFQFPSSTWHPSTGTTWLMESFGGTIGTAYRTVNYAFEFRLPTSVANGEYWLTLTVAGPDNRSATKTVTVTKDCG